MRPWVFGHQVIDKDADVVPEGTTPKTESEEPDKPGSFNEQEHQEENLHGSQYDSEQGGYPLDEYEDYIEVKNFDVKNEDVVYIWSSRIEEENSFEPKLVNLDNTSDKAISIENNTDSVSTNTISVSDSTVTLVNGTDSPPTQRYIPWGMMPYELLISLPDEIYTCQMWEQDPNWSPPEYDIQQIEIYHVDNRVLPDISMQLLHMGYMMSKENEDAKWIHCLALNDISVFTEVMGYYRPPDVYYTACGECLPEVLE